MVHEGGRGTDFDVLADNLRTDGYTKPKDDDGVWEGGADLVAWLDGTLAPRSSTSRCWRTRVWWSPATPPIRRDRGEGRLRGR